MQGNKKQQSPSVKNQENTDSMPTTLPGNQDSSSVKLYLSILKMPLQCFVDCLCFHNYDAVVEQGDPAQVDPKLKVEAWVAIYREYVDAIGDSAHQLYMNLLKEKTFLSIKIDVVEKGVSWLQTMYTRHNIFKPENQTPEVLDQIAEFTNMFNEQLNTTFEYDPSDQNKFLKTLDRCLTRIKSSKLEFEIKSRALEGMQKTMESKTEKPTEEYFFSTLYALSDHAGFKLSMEEITVHEYCTRVKALNKHIERLNNGKANPR
jgi:archaellum component FlaC